VPQGITRSHARAVAQVSHTVPATPRAGLDPHAPPPCGGAPSACPRLLHREALCLLRATSPALGTRSAVRPRRARGVPVSARLASAAVTASPLDGPALQAVLKPWDAAAYPLQARRLRVLELPSHGRICGAETRVPAA